MLSFLDTLYNIQKTMQETSIFLNLDQEHLN